MLKSAIFFLCSFASSLISPLGADNISNFEKGPTPEWVEECEVQLEPILLKPSQVNTQQLLIDTQRNIEEKTLYWHFANKPLTQNGVGIVAQFNIDFNPYYQKLIVHKIRIYRDGKWYDRLDSTRLELLKREENLENSLIGGDLTLAHFLEDIREGDIVEYACSFVGVNPLFPQYSSCIKLQVSSVTEKVSHRILSHPNTPISYRAFNTSAEPRIRDLSSNLREWTWEAFSTTPASYEEARPAWYNPAARVQISLYKSWQEVAQIIAPLYALPENFKERAMPAMKELTKKWKEASEQPAERALLALRFVQDEIRYMGFEEGIGAYKPCDPNRTLQRRFGDCKDKAFLLCALLSLMDIQSQPVLVQTEDNRILDKLLPSPLAFNHVILQIDIGDRLYRCDPTLSLQGGSLDENYLPDYRWGLVVAEKTTQLSCITEFTSVKPSKINTSYLFTSPESVDLTIVRRHYGSTANNYRKYLANAGYEKFSELFVKDIKMKYPLATVSSPIDVKDDRYDNSFSFTEKYTISTNDVSNRKVIHILTLTLETYFDRDINLERTAPYSLIYPCWIEEEVLIENPFSKYTAMSEKLEKYHDSFWFRQHATAEGTKFNIVSEFQHTKDHVPLNAVQTYWDIFKELEKDGIWQASFLYSATPPEQSSNNLFTFYAIPCLLLIAMRYYFYRQNKKKTFIA